MGYNPIQLQHGMALPGFLCSIGTEAQCAEAVKRARWPNGFRCPKFASERHYVVGHGARNLFQYQACRHQTSLIAVSLFENTKLPLATWFLAIYLIS